MLLKKSKSDSLQCSPELRVKVEDLIRRKWGPRCETRDTEDFPEITGTDSRCPSCPAYEKFDEFWDYAISRE